MKKQTKTQVVILACLSLLISCLPNTGNNGGNTNGSSKNVRKSSNYILQDNVNGRIITPEFDNDSKKIFYNYNSDSNLSSVKVYDYNTLSEKFEEVANATISYYNSYLIVKAYTALDAATNYQKIFFDEDKNIIRIKEYGNVFPNDGNNPDFKTYIYKANGELDTVFFGLNYCTNFVYNGDNLVQYDKFEFDPFTGEKLYTFIKKLTYGSLSYNKGEHNDPLFETLEVMENDGINPILLTGLKFGKSTSSLITNVDETEIIHSLNNQVVDKYNTYDLVYTVDNQGRVVTKKKENLYLQSELTTDPFYLDEYSYGY